MDSPWESAAVAEAAAIEEAADASEADQSIVKAQLRDFEPLESEHHRIVQVDTRDADAVEKVIGSLRELL